MNSKAGWIVWVSAIFLPIYEKCWVLELAWSHQNFHIKEKNFLHHPLRGQSFLTEGCFLIRPAIVFLLSHGQWWRDWMLVRINYWVEGVSKILDGVLVQWMKTFSIYWNILNLKTHTLYFYICIYREKFTNGLEREHQDVVLVTKCTRRSQVRRMCLQLWQWTRCQKSFLFKYDGHISSSVVRHHFT